MKCYFPSNTHVLTAANCLISPGVLYNDHEKIDRGNKTGSASSFPRMLLLTQAHHTDRWQMHSSPGRSLHLHSSTAVL